jgi:hypothetical protein
MKINAGELVEICVEFGCFQGFFKGEVEDFYVLDVLVSDLKIETYIRKDYVVVLKRKLKISQQA